MRNSDFHLSTESYFLTIIQQEHHLLLWMDRQLQHGEQELSAEWVFVIYQEKDCHTVGIVGAGAQGFHQALYACAARDIHTVYVFNHSDRDLTDYLARLEKAIDDPSVKVVQCKTIEELVKASDIICTTTPAKSPVLPDDKELLRGKCIIAIGSYTPEMREIPNAIWELVDKVYIELPYACEESGDLSQPLADGHLKEEQTVLMNEYLASDEDKEIAEGQTTYFKSVGMALFDVCIAQKLLEMSKEK